ncbi:MAG: Rrf2 family transcriptional regulator [Enterocloster clostridioformis]
MSVPMPPGYGRSWQSFKKADLVETKEGVDGGYLFHRDSRDVNLSMVAEALDTPLWPPHGRAATRHMACLISSGMAGIMDELYGELNQCCQAYLEKVTIADLDSKIFTGTPKTVTAT